jgi:hypothetical protein
MTVIMWNITVCYDGHHFEDLKDEDLFWSENADVTAFHYD